MRIAQYCIRRFLMVVVLVAALILGPGAPPVYAGGVVGNGTPGSCTEAAFNTALGGGGSVTFNCGPAPHTILITSQKSINLNTTIDGGGTITLDGQDAHRLFDVGAVLTLRNIVLTRGYFNGDGGAIRNNSNGTLVVENSTIRYSRATFSGGAILSTGPLTIINSLLENNEALNGGALYPRFAGARTKIINSALRYNRATDTTNGWGGAILAWDGALVAIESSDISSNTARFGGGIFSFGINSVLMLQSNTLLRDNRADNSGGGLYNEGTANLVYATLNGNSAPYGGGLYNSSPIGGDPAIATLTNVTLRGNSALYAGGLLNNGTITLTNVTLSGNSVTDDGGGLINNSIATLTNTTFSGNTAGYDGGGLQNSGTVMLTNVTFSGNWAVQYGGGLINSNGTATLTNATFSGNSAAVVGGGIYRDSGSVIVKNTIVANSLPGGGCAGGMTNYGFNLASDMSCGFNYIPNVMLGPLADNGGPTKTHQPLPGSPAIDYVTAGCPPPVTDQRGAARPVGTACDAGAVEYGAVLPRAYLPIMLN